MRVVLCLCLSLCPALAQSTGAGNARAEQIAAVSAPVAKARAKLMGAAASIRNPLVRDATKAILRDSGVCVVSRQTVDTPKRAAIMRQLLEAHLIDAGVPESGVFPPLAESARCPAVPQSFFAAPGSTFHGHHSYPGGLAIHEAVNLTSAANFARLYQESFGFAAPADVLTAAPIWHDWAKTVVFQWNADGSEFAEVSFGGDETNGTKTPAHHIIGLAEAMARNFPPSFVLTQASAHAAPTAGNAPKVINWIRAAAMLASVDPVERGYLIHTGDQWDLPGGGLRAEYTLHNLSDADFNFSGPAVARAEELLTTLEPEFPHQDQWVYRNPILSGLTAERLVFIFQAGGMDAVRSQIKSILYSHAQTPDTL